MNTRILAAIAFVWSVAPDAPLLAQEWVEVTPASGPAPTARTLAAAVYDPVAHAMVVFGGQDDATRTNDVWSFDLTTHAWTDVTPISGSAPAGRITPSAVYDPDHHQLLTFSGQGNGGVFLNDTWGFDLASYAWTEYTPAAPMPTTRYGVASCYDTVANTQVTFAGFTFQGRYDDTWRFDPDADAWTDVTPVSTSPLERCLHAACFDAAGYRMIMYGGQNAGALGDVWAFDLALETWTEITPASGPDPRWFSTFEYDAQNHRVTMFAGNRGLLGLSNEVWLLDLADDQWVSVSPAGTPPVARDGAAAVYVESEDRFVVFGGNSSGGKLNDVWSLEHLSDTVTGVESGPVATAALLRQNIPNPFNPSTVIRYSIRTPGAVSLRVYDVRGALVRVLDDRHREAGDYEATWTGETERGTRAASGVYFYRLTAPGVSQTRKMVLAK
jgi:hypothetical protein